MIDEQIIKAFEEVTRDNNIPITHQIICGDVLRLINCQKAENERLNVEIKSMRGAANSYKLENERLLQKLQQAKS